MATKILYPEIVEIISNSSAPDILEFYVFNASAQVVLNGQQPEDFDSRGLYVVNNSADHYEETLLIIKDGRIMYFPHLHPSDNLSMAFSEAYGSAILANAEELREHLQQ